MFDRSGHLIAERTRFVDDLVSLMTLEEMLGQLVMYDLGGESTDGGLSSDLTNALKRGEVGTLWLGKSSDGECRKTIIAAQDTVVSQSRLGTPLMVACDLSGGYRTALPGALTAACSWDPETIARADRIAAIEASADGANWAFGPAIVTDNDDALCADEPMLAARIIGARVRGLQGDRLIRPDTMLASLDCRSRNTENGANTAHLNDFLPPYLAAARDGRVGCVNFETTSKQGARLIDPLALNWDFGAIVVSQWRDIARSALGDAYDEADPWHFPIAAIAASVRDGTTPLVMVEDAVRRVLGAKFDLGLFRDPDLYLHRDAAEPSVTPAVHREVALDVARKSVTLLKNVKQVLPLDSDNGTILVLGPRAEDGQSAIGGNGRSRSATALCDGLLAQGMIHSYLRGTGRSDEPDDSAREGFGGGVGLSKGDRMAIGLACDAASRAHTVVVAIGDADERHPEGIKERLLVQAVAKANPRIVLVVLNETPPDLGWAAPLAAGIIYAGQLGIASGEAIAQVLCGQFNPGGKLPVALPVVDTRDGQRRALFPFGHGLSYTSFAYRDFALEVLEDRVVAMCLLRNIGEVAGEEVAQLYVRNHTAFGHNAAARLKCFTKVRLEPGEMRELRFELSAGEFGYYCEDGRLQLTAGYYELGIGGSSARTIMRELELPEIVARAMLQIVDPRDPLRNSSVIAGAFGRARAAG